MQPTVTKTKRWVSAKEAERDESLALLRERLKPGTTVYTLTRSVSYSNMSRTLDFYVVENNDICRITWSVARVLHGTYDRRREAFRVTGCGMDMGWKCVYDLAYIVLGDGYALKHQWL